MDSIAESDATIKKALGVADMLKQNELDRLLYLRYQMRIHEEITAREASLEEGIELGKTEGQVGAVSAVAGIRFPGLTPHDERRLQAVATRDSGAAVTAVSTCGDIGELRAWLTRSEAGCDE